MYVQAEERRQVKEAEELTEARQHLQEETERLSKQRAALHRDQQGLVADQASAEVSMPVPCSCGAFLVDDPIPSLIPPLMSKGEICEDSRAGAKGRALAGGHGTYWQQAALIQLMTLWQAVSQNV